MDAALAELEKQKENPEAILELSQKAEAYKKKGNERLKERLRGVLEAFERTTRNPAPAKPWSCLPAARGPGDGLFRAQRGQQDGCGSCAWRC